MNTVHRFAAAALATGALVVPVALSSSAAAAGPIITGGLVNVTVADSLNNVLSDNQVSLGAALGIAANVCDVNVNVLARQLRSGGATCTSDASGQTVDISQITG